MIAATRFKLSYLLFFAAIGILFNYYALYLQRVGLSGTQAKTLLVRRACVFLVHIPRRPRVPQQTGSEPVRIFLSGQLQQKAFKWRIEGIPVLEDNHFSGPLAAFANR